MEAHNAPVNWQPWITEMNRFKARKTQGFTLDVEALRDHIERLKGVAPKSKFGTMHSTAAREIGSLKFRLRLIEPYLPSTQP